MDVKRYRVAAQVAMRLLWAEMRGVPRWVWLLTAAIALASLGGAAVLQYRYQSVTWDEAMLFEAAVVGFGLAVGALRLRLRDVLAARTELGLAVAAGRAGTHVLILGVHTVYLFQCVRLLTVRADGLPWWVEVSIGALPLAAIFNALSTGNDLLVRRYVERQDTEHYE